MPNIIRGHVKYPPRQLVPASNHRDVRAANFEAPPWTDKEDAIIRKCYRDTEARLLGERLGRSYKAVQLRAMKLGVSRKRVVRVA